MSMRDINCQVLSNEQVALDIYKMVLQADRVDDIEGGMFVNIKIPNNEMLLRRPLCLCDFDEAKKTFTVLYAVVGEGTKVLSKIKVGETLNCMLPLGNGFYPKELGYKKVLLIGGGMGAAVLPTVARRNKDVEFVSYLGFANKDKVILEEELKEVCSKVVVATDNGSYGESGFVTNIVKRDLDSLGVDAIFCCGPEVMFKALAKTLEGVDLPIYVSLEARMGCGIGACLVCNCKVRRNGEEGYYRVCKDGPVFLLKEVVL